MIFPEDAGKFPDVGSLSGKVVEVTGSVRLYKGKPEIILRRADQIKARAGAISDLSRLGALAPAPGSILDFAASQHAGDGATGRKRQNRPFRKELRT